MKKAFTLIELLVVIAIIAILAAILFPVFAQAKAAAKKTQALSNIKNVGTALVIYTADNDDYYPRSQNSNFSVGGTYDQTQNYEWTGVVYPYVKNGTVSANAGTYTGANVGGAGSIFTDPIHPKQNQWNQFGVHGDMMPECMPWDIATGASPSTCTPVRSQTILPSVAETVAIAVKGANNNEGSSFPQIDTSGYDWLTAAEATAYQTAGQTGATPDSRYKTNGDCDAASSWSYGFCASLPRMHHGSNGGQASATLVSDSAANIPTKNTSGSVVVSFFDTHAKSMKKGNLNWGTHFHVSGVNDL